MKRKLTAVTMAVLLVGTTACGTPADVAPSATPTTGIVQEQKPEDITGQMPEKENVENNIEENAETSTEPITTVETLVTADGEVKVSELQTLAAQASIEQATKITLNGNQVQIEGNGCKEENGTVRITQAGTYVVSGKLEKGSIVVDADKESLVYLILNGVDITNPNGPAIYGKKAEKLIITLAEGTTNVLTDGKAYVFEKGTEEPDAALFAKQDLLINGMGELVVQANYGDAIKGKDALYLFDGSYQIMAEDEGITGKDLLYIQNGTYVVQAKGDGLKASEDTDTELGNLVIADGTFTISSEDDGIHAENGLVITGGTITIPKSEEGLEGATVDIYGGNMDITSADDGINAAGGSASSKPIFGFRFPMGGMQESNYAMNFYGGNILVNAAGDALDANGTIFMSGGTLVVYGPEHGANGAFDYDKSFAINGGTLFVTGSAGMAQSPDASSTQNVISAVFPTVQSAGSELVVTAADGTELCKATVPKKFQQFIYSSADLKTGETYTLSINGETLLEGTIDSVITYFGAIGAGSFAGGFGGFDGGRNHGGFGRGERPEGEPPEGFGGEFPNGEPPEGFHGDFPDKELPGKSDIEV